MSESRLNDQIVGADLAAKYDAIAYASKPVALSHPAHLATVATLFGVDPPAVASCRTLELGCSDGANLIPMAVTLPGATFVGVELASRPVEAARRTAAELALANVSFLQADLRALPVDFGSFDYIIAHGVYSWVPAPVRDALLALAARHLTANGVMFVSYNTLPGCHVRRVAWDILHFHTDHIADPQARIDAARALACTAVAEPSGASEFQRAAAFRNLGASRKCRTAPFSTTISPFRTTRFISVSSSRMPRATASSFSPKRRYRR